MRLNRCGAVENPEARRVKGRGGHVSAWLERVPCGLAVLGLTLFGMANRCELRAASNPPPTFREVSGLVRSNLAGADLDELDRLAVAGFLAELGPRVVLLDAADELKAGAAVAGVLEARVYRGSVGYVRLGGMDAATGDLLWERYQALTVSNRLSGLVLDLRAAGGSDYAAALRVADLFLTQEVPLLNWGEGLKRSRAKDQAITLPVAVLMNRETAGGAEALAGMLRQSGVALLIGGRTAGTAGIQRAFPLSNGQFLNITVANIQLGDARMLTADGLKPDVEVAVDAAREVAWLNGQPAGDVGDSAGPGPTSEHSPLRMNEADLVRRWRGEMLSAEESPVAGPENGLETRDPVLVRALDLMDGLAILRSWQK
ncbi:MAG: S41 family peptidase [Verrucomicrobia bacterium]|nr:S41 family peptidase [Verrucomicrobiota bacterium]